VWLMIDDNVLFISKRSLLLAFPPFVFWIMGLVPFSCIASWTDFWERGAFSYDFWKCNERVTVVT